MKENLDLQEIYVYKKTVVMKDENEKARKKQKEPWKNK